MRTLPAIFAVSLAVLLTVAPLTASAAGIVTFTSPTAGAQVSGSFTIAGTVSPAQSGADSVFIEVTNPNGSPVTVADVPATPNTGAFSYATSTGSGTLWPTGTYTITATDSYSATGSTTFTFQAPPPASTGSGVTLQMSAVASNPVMPGDTVEVSALVYWSNGTVPSSATFTGWWISPSGTATKLTATPTAPAGTTGVWWWSIPVSSSAADGLNAIVLGASVGKTTAWTQTSFTVDSSFASSSSVAALANQLAALSKMVSSVSGTANSTAAALTSLSNTVSTGFSGVNSAISGLSQTVGGIQSSLTQVSSQVSTINTAVGQIQTSLGTLSTNVGNVQTAATNAANAAASAQSAANDAKTAINNTSTYVLAVVVIAAITLVLELAILVRKLS